MRFLIITDGNYNTAIGDLSLYNNVSADGNVAVGHKSLETNTTGEFNVSIGSYSLQKVQHPLQMLQ